MKDHSEVTEEMIDLVAKTAANEWKRLAFKLPIANTLAECIVATDALVYKYPGNIKDQCFFMLVKWVNEQENATAQQLIKCLRSLDQHKVASEIEKMLNMSIERNDACDTVSIQVDPAENISSSAQHRETQDSFLLTFPKGFFAGLNTATSDNLSQKTFKKIEDIDTDTSNGIYWFPSMTVDDDNNLFVCDSTNKCVKCIHSSKVKWTVQLPTQQPLSIDILNTGEVAVMLSDNDSLWLLDRQTGYKLRHVRHGIVCDYPTISVYNEIIVIGDSNNRKVSVCSMTKEYELETLWSIFEHQPGRPSLKYPCYVHITAHSHILVTDDVQTLQSFDITGEHQFTYGNCGPAVCGVCSDKAGNIIAPDASNKKVVLLSPSGKVIKDLLTKETGLKYMNGLLALSLSRQGTLYVSSYFDSNIQVFQS